MLTAFATFHHKTIFDDDKVYDELNLEITEKS
jgi:hypothetical protein